MEDKLPFSAFITRFPTDQTCLAELMKLRYPKGIFCVVCRDYTSHYKVGRRIVYACTHCRRQTFPLANTLFEKTSTPLRLWFYAMFLMTQTYGRITAKQLQRELGVTYKTAWRMRKLLYTVMQQGNLLADTIQAEDSVHKWVFFNTIEITLAQKQERL